MAKTKGQNIADLLVDYLKSTNSLSDLPDIVKALSAVGKKQGLVDSAIVTSPSKLSETELKTIAAYVKHNYGDKYQVVEKIDPSLVAGFTIHVGDEVIDSSLSSKLKELRKELV